MSQKPDLKDVNGLELDRRVWAYDEDRRIAEIALKGRLEGEWGWVEPQDGFIICNASPELFSDLERVSNSRVTQVLANEPIQILWETDNFNGFPGESLQFLIRTVHDSYLGWLDPKNTLSIGQAALLESFFSLHPKNSLTHRQVHTLRAHIYMEPSIKSTTIHDNIAFGSSVFIPEQVDHIRKEDWLYIEIEGAGDAWIHKSALEPSNLPPLEWVKGFLGTPYLWGGRTAWGIDCSGLAQMYFRYQNIYIPRDADQQEAAFAAVSEPRAGDLAFFDGHVGILLEQNERGNWRLLHANSRHMSVTVDTLGEGEYGAYLSSILHGFGRWEGEIGVYWKPK